MNKLEDIFVTIGGVFKFIIFLMMISLMVPITLLYRRFDKENRYRVSLVFYSAVLRLLGIKTRVKGSAVTTAPVLFVVNHVSYLDVIVLGSLLPASFIAKSEVAGWPLFGYLAKIQNTIFIERRQTRAVDQKNQLQNYFAADQNIILFPEGTSSDGLGLLPFKSSLFSIVDTPEGSKTVTVQPISITCVELDGYPMLREERALYAWYGDMTLMPHLWNVFRRGHFTLEVIFHRPVPAGLHANRKLLSSACQDLVARGIETSLAGRASKEAPLLADHSEDI